MMDDTLQPMDNRIQCRIVPGTDLKKDGHGSNDSVFSNSCLKTVKVIGIVEENLHLHRKSPAIDAVFRASRTIAMAPVKFHLLSFESTRQAGTTDKIVIFQKDGNCFPCVLHPGFVRRLTIESIKLQFLVLFTDTCMLVEDVYRRLVSAPTADTRCDPVLWTIGTRVCPVRVA